MGRAEVGTAPRAAPRRQRRGLERIALILDTADQVFAEVGYAGATTNLIAARAGISPGSLYQYFANKEAIAEALATRYVEVMDAAYGEVLDPAVAELPLPELVDRVVDPLLELHLAHPGAKDLLGGADLTPALAEATQHLHEAVLDQTEAVLAARLPDLDPTARRRATVVTAQIFKGIQPAVVAAPAADRPALVAELKAALVGYWQVLEAGAEPGSRVGLGEAGPRPGRGSTAEALADDRS